MQVNLTNKQFNASFISESIILYYQKGLYYATVEICSLSYKTSSQNPVGIESADLADLSHVAMEHTLSTRTCQIF